MLEDRDNQDYVRIRDITKIMLEDRDNQHYVK